MAQNSNNVMENENQMFQAFQNINSSEPNLLVIIEKAEIFEDHETFGKMDCYLKFKFANQEQEYKTQTANDQGKYPVWNQSFQMFFDEKNEKLEIELWEEDVGSDDYLGKLILDVKKEISVNYPGENIELKKEILDKKMEKPIGFLKLMIQQLLSEEKKQEMQNQHSETVKNNLQIKKLDFQQNLDPKDLENKVNEIQNRLKNVKVRLTQKPVQPYDHTKIHRAIIEGLNIIGKDRCIDIGRQDNLILGNKRTCSIVSQGNSYLISVSQEDYQNLLYETHKKEEKQIIEQLEQFNCFKNTKYQDWSIILPFFKKVTYSRNQILYKQGQKQQDMNIYFILEGAIQIERYVEIDKQTMCINKRQISKKQGKQEQYDHLKKENQNSEQKFNFTYEVALLEKMEWLGEEEIYLNLNLRQQTAKAISKETVLIEVNGKVNKNKIIIIQFNLIHFIYYLQDFQNIFTKFKEINEIMINLVQEKQIIRKKRENRQKLLAFKKFGIKNLLTNPQKSNYKKTCQISENLLEEVNKEIKNKDQQNQLNTKHTWQYQNKKIIQKQQKDTLQLQKLNEQGLKNRGKSQQSSPKKTKNIDFQLQIQQQGSLTSRKHVKIDFLNEIDSVKKKKKDINQELNQSLRFNKENQIINRLDNKIDFDKVAWYRRQ
ncbi:Cyclic nucleotide-binding protein [Pseudocohnilembus persalinus]|uniref:Cyclic nucleotide-binding protein n=1 Tax=Pseudocohnilembus persalinus TaxID=266149 RepID=A0A0V0QYP3_PSEPJ|nr:Cyclic nucleotide-binding protein [Pseudocohnilembus persalinus]|eukprot:KRX07423.1 Cyclic nucleotide-binding protein [Pseudocohnilembus persalinus]